MKQLLTSVGLGRRVACIKDVAEWGALRARVCKSLDIRSGFFGL